jgi:hypothetical protein
VARPRFSPVLERAGDFLAGHGDDGGQTRRKPLWIYPMWLGGFLRGLSQKPVGQKKSDQA